LLKASIDSLGHIFQLSTIITIGSVSRNLNSISIGKFSSDFGREVLLVRATGSCNTEISLVGFSA
jgi:hypothetical protein